MGRLVQNQVVDREEWLKARAELLTKEKEHTQARAALAEARRRLPWVKLQKEYSLVGADGQVSLSDVFLDRSQLAIYHIMFGPGWDSVCIGCTQWANALNSTTGAFKKADARLIAVSRAPFDEIEVQREKLGWNFTWLSSFGSDFTVDFFASSNDLSEGASAAVGVETVQFDRGENHGVNVFYRNGDGEIFHTYSAFNRGIEELNGAFGYFDLLPKGRAW
jgi:predicted dithiol-disulfide oxidoreductase (DUF899 family)